MKKQKDPSGLISIFLRFLKFGLLAWGGPVAQISMIKEELVDKEKWISGDKFKRTLAVYQALPGPEAHELCVYFGMVRAGKWGGFLAGLGFMIPGFILMVLLSWIYTTFGSAALVPLFAFMAPAVCALIVRAAHKIGGHILQDKPLIYAGILSVILTLLQVHFLLVFLISVVFGLTFLSKKKLIFSLFLVSLIVTSIAISGFSFGLNISHLLPNGGLFFEGLKAGLLSFGGAYTAIPFLQNSMVGNYEMITTNSFLDGIALANVIPAPLVIFGTYLGFLAGSFKGAILITIGIFLPAFSFTLLGHKQLEKLIENKTFHGILDSISAAVVGILIVTALQIFLHTIHTPLQAFLFVISLGCFYFLKFSYTAPLVIFGSAIFGYLLNSF